MSTLTTDERKQLAALGQPLFNHRIGHWSDIPREAFFQWHLERDGLHLTWAASATVAVGGRPTIHYRGVLVDYEEPGPWMDAVRKLMPELEAEVARANEVRTAANSAEAEKLTQLRESLQEHQREEPGQIRGGCRLQNRVVPLVKTTRYDFKALVRADGCTSAPFCDCGPYWRCQHHVPSNEGVSA